MANERVERLIADLAAEAAPVTRLSPVRHRLAWWIVLAMAVSATGIWMLGPRTGMWRAVGSPAVLWAVGLMAGVATVAAVLALRLSVPGVDRTPWIRIVPLALWMVWAGILLVMSLQVGGAASDLLREPLHPPCAAIVTTLALGPTMLLMRSVRKGFTLEPAWTAFLVAAGGAALAAAATQFVCPIDRPAHLFVAHALPVAAVAAVVALAIRRWWV